MRWFEIIGTAWLVFLGSACSPSRSAPSEGSSAENAPAQVQVTQPARRDLARAIRLPGSVEAFEQATLHAKAAGYLKRIHVDKGDRVRNGQVLAELEIPEMVREREEVEARLTEARAKAKLARLTFERFSQIREKDPEVISQQEVDVARAEMEKAVAGVSVAEANKARVGAMMEYSVLRAPFSGIVTERFVDRGTLIQTAAATRQATPVVTVMNMSVVRVYVHVSECEVAHIQRGTPATMEVDALRGRSFEGAVTRFTSVLDPATRTMKVEIDIPNPDGALLHGMYGHVTLTLDERPQALTVPAESVWNEGGRQYVLAVEDGVVVKLEVTGGLDDGRVVEIVTGLEGNERVIMGDRSGLRGGMEVVEEAAPDGGR
ncbi:MAG: efflux RND transporter periplasmic adaptor subunit [Acidobacteriota bacterium]